MRLFQEQFNQLNQIMCSLTVSAYFILDFKTSRHVIIVSEQFTKKKDRSITFAGLYAITIDSVAPVSRVEDLKKSIDFKITIWNHSG